VTSRPPQAMTIRSLPMTAVGTTPSDPTPVTPATILFDLDGTLVDTAPDLLGTLSWLLVEEGLDPLDMAQARDLIGHGIRPMVEKALRRAGRGDTVDEVEAVYGRYIAAYEARIARESRPYPGIVEALDHFASQGMRLCVATNKIHRLSVMLLDALELSHRFTVIAGADTYGVRKPDPGHLLNAIRDAGGDPRRAVMVGDSEPDIRAAQAAKIPVIGYSGGYTQIPLEALKPDVIISDYSKLPSIVAGLIG